jgi:hypothetical protein
MSSNCPSIVTEFVLQMRQLVVLEEGICRELQHPCHKRIIELLVVDATMPHAGSALA